jgi:hypothetical protein
MIRYGPIVVDWIGTLFTKIRDLTERRTQRRRGILHHLSDRRKSEQSSEKSKKTSLLTREWGLHGVSFDAIPNTDVNDNMFAVSKGLKKREGDGHTTAVQHQISLNRGWKLLVIGMTQGEAFARYEAMVDLARSLPNLMDTLDDPSTRYDIGMVLMNISVSDERAENRLKAIYLLGQFASLIGALEECEGMMDRIFKHLAKMMIERQHALKESGDGKSGFADIRLHLIRSIGKFTAFKKNSRDCLVMYLVHEELRMIFEKENNHIHSGNPDLYVLLAVLDLLNNNVSRAKLIL